MVNTYNNIDSFWETAHALYPNATDRELASFVIEYIGQDSSALSEEDLLNVLQYKSISTSTSYITVAENGNYQELSEEEFALMPLDIYNSPDGYMKLETNYALKRTVGSEKYFGVWVCATWLKWPAIALNDVLILSTNGVFDSSHNESAYVNQTFYCNSLSICSKYSLVNRTVNKNSPIKDDLILKYSNYTPYISFVPLSPKCNYCGGPAKDIYFRAYLSYGIITSGTCNIQAHYGHTTIGITDIGVGIKNGEVTLTPKLGAQITQYDAQPVTVK